MHFSDLPYASCLELVKSLYPWISHCAEVRPLEKGEISTVRQVICNAEKQVQLGHIIGLIRLYELEDGKKEMTVEVGAVVQIHQFWGTYARVGVKTLNMDGSDGRTTEYWISCSCFMIPCHLLTYKDTTECTHYCFKLRDHF
jgi:hypothetical protein